MHTNICLAAANMVIKQLIDNPTLTVPVDEDVAVLMGLSEEPAMSLEDFSADGLLRFGRDGVGTVEDEGI